jgi:N-acetylglucosamine malate deacetylase 1
MKKMIGHLFFIGSIVFSLHECLADVDVMKLSEAHTVIVFSPHPDDDILGCGGAMLTHIASGARVVIVYMTSGEAMRGIEDQELLVIREAEAKNAAQKIGIYEQVFLREPDSKLLFSPSNLGKIADLLREIQPDLIYIPHKKDGHPDHKETNKIVTETVRSLIREKNSWKELTILGYEVWTPIENVSYCLNIDKYIEKKLEALAEHRSQIMALNYVDAIKALNRYRGLMSCECSYSEGFEKIIIN